jgi:hypothetical protein
MTPEESAYAILELYNVPGLLVPRVKAVGVLASNFDKAGHHASFFKAGLEYAIERGWVVRAKTALIQLTEAGFDEIERLNGVRS